MNFNLLSQNLLLLWCGATALLTMYCITQLKKAWRRQLIALVGVSYVAAFMFQLAINYYFDETTPISLVFMIMPFTFMAGIFVFVLSKDHHLRLRWLAGGSMAFSLLFSLILINNYYRFYPTLGSVFNKTNVASLGAKQSSIAVRYANNQKQSPTGNPSSVEGALDSFDKQSTDGSVYSLNIPGVHSHFKARSAFVYVPAIARTVPNTKLPVIVLTPGFPGLPENWLGSGLQTTMDTFAKKHKGITPLIFMVDDTGSLTNDTECVNSPRGNAETYLTDDVPAYIKAHFDVAATPDHWAIGGLSMGGMCSVMLALRHPDVYRYFDDIAGEAGPEIGSQQKTIDLLFGGSQTDWAAHQPGDLLAGHTYSNMGGFFGSGKQDTLQVTEATHELYDEAQKAGIESIYETIDGQHTFNVWQQLFQDSLPWLSNRIGATECGPCY